MAQEGTTAMHTPREFSPPSPNCPPQPSYPPHSTPPCRSIVEKGLVLRGQPRTAGSISGLTLDANANVGLGTEQTLWAIWPLVCRGWEGRGVDAELIQTWISGQHGRVDSLENATTWAQPLPATLIKSKMHCVFWIQDLYHSQTLHSWACQCHILLNMSIKNY